MATPTKTSTDSTAEVLLEVMKRLQRINADFTVSSLSSFLGLLSVSQGKEKDARQEDIGNKVGKSQGLVSKQLGIFVDRGLLTKEIHPTSEREKVYTLTPMGMELMSDLTKILKG